MQTFERHSSFWNLNSIIHYYFDTKMSVQNLNAIICTDAFVTEIFPPNEFSFIQTLPLLLLDGGTVQL